MKELLKQISFYSIKLEDFEYSDEQIKSKWLGNSPATEEAITLAEKRLNIHLPQDYKEFLRICNGFDTTNNVEPTFNPIEDIDYLRNLNPALIKIWNETGNDEIGKILHNSILVAGIGEEQYFLLIPPNEATKTWKYWKFASWIPGEEEYDDFITYWNEVFQFNKEELNEK